MPLIRWKFDEKGANKVGRELKASAESTRKLEKQIIALNKRAEMKEAQEGSKEYQEALERLTGASKKATKESKGFGQALTSINQGLELAKKGLSVAKELGAFAREGALANDAAARFTGSLEDLRSASGGLVDDTSLQNFAYRAEQLGLSRRQVLDLTESMAVLTIRAADGSSAIDNMNAALDGQQEKMRKLGVSISKTGEEFKGLDESGSKQMLALAASSMKVKDGLNIVEEGAGSQAAQIGKVETSWANMISTVQQAVATEMMAAGSSEDLTNNIETLASSLVTVVSGAATLIGTLGKLPAVGRDLSDWLTGNTREYIELSDGSRVLKESTEELEAGLKKLRVLVPIGALVTDVVRRQQDASMTTSEWARRTWVRTEASRVGTRQTAQETAAVRELTLAQRSQISSLEDAVTMNLLAMQSQVDMQASMARFDAMRAKISSGGGSKRANSFGWLPSKTELQREFFDFKIEARAMIQDLAAWRLEQWEGSFTGQAVNFLGDLGQEQLGFSAALERAGGDLTRWTGVFVDQARIRNSAREDEAANNAELLARQAEDRRQYQGILIGSVGQVANAWAKNSQSEATAAWISAGIGALQNTWQGLQEVGLGNPVSAAAHFAAAATAITTQALAAKYKGGGGGGGGAPQDGGSVLSGRTSFGSGALDEAKTSDDGSTETVLVVDRQVLGRAAINGANSAGRFSNIRLDSKHVANTGRSFG